jgi:mono/diheme cytochrome c family protein
MKTAWILAIALLGTAGCEKAARNMYDGAREKPLAANPRFANGTSSRPQVAGTVEHGRGVIAATSSGRAGADATRRRAQAEESASNPYPMTLALLERGRGRFEIYCVPCHSPVGDGDGRIARRGFPRPPSYHIDRLRAAPDRHFYDVITLGYGVMYPYADRVEPEDRWAIVAYIRALQRSQAASPADVPSNISAGWSGR